MATLETGGNTTQPPLEGGRTLPAIPAAQAEYLVLIRQIFTDLEPAGVTVREFTLDNGSALTAICLEDLIRADDLRRLVLDPLAQSQPAESPERVLRTCAVLAVDTEQITTEDELRETLLAGYIALHLDGRPDALAVRDHPPVEHGHQFGSDLRENRIRLSSAVQSAGLRFQMVPCAHGSRNFVVYLEGVAEPDLVDATAAWIRQRSTPTHGRPFWRLPANLLRLPPMVPFHSPVAVAELLHRGYVAVLADLLPDVHVAPTTLELLLTGPLDYVLDPAVRAFLRWPRVLAAEIALQLGALFVAITSYHHTLLTGPLLGTVTAHRQNLPLPIVAEMIVVLLLDDLLWAGLARTGGQRWGMAATIGTVLLGLTAIEAGLLGAITTMVGLLSCVVVLVLPNRVIAARLRLWRYLFCLAGAALGVFGIAILQFALAIYLGHETHLNQPLREKPEVLLGK